MSSRQESTKGEKVMLIGIHVGVQTRIDATEMTRSCENHIVEQWLHRHTEKGHWRYDLGSHQMRLFVHTGAPAVHEACSGAHPFPLPHMCPLSHRFLKVQ